MDYPGVRQGIGHEQKDGDDSNLKATILTSDYPCLQSR